MYILSQLLVIICYLLLGITYLNNNRKSILIIGIYSLIALGISYLLLSAYTGVAMVAIAIIRNIIFYYEEKSFKKNLTILIIIYLISIFFAIITYDGIKSLFSLLETMLYTYSLWQKNPKAYNIIGIPTSISCIIYHILIKSLFGIILETIVLISDITGLIINNKSKNHSFYEP